MMMMMNDCEIRIGDEKCLVEYVRKASPPPFLVKTYMLVEDPATDEVISWNGEGTAFVVWQPAEFSRDLLPTLFKHSNFSSFVRQLNTYGFRKVATNRWEFSNDMFRKGERDKLCEIRRRKAAAAACSNKQPQVVAPSTKDHHIINSSDEDDNEEDQRYSSSANSSSDQLLFLLDDNKRLQQENEVLSSELALMKKKCKQLLHLVAINNHGLGNTNNSSWIEEEEEECTVVDDDHDQYKLEEEKMINTSTTDEAGPKLFGVRLIRSEIKKRKLKGARSD